MTNVELLRITRQEVIHYHYADISQVDASIEVCAGYCTVNFGAQCDQASTLENAEYLLANMMQSYCQYHNIEYHQMLGIPEPESIQGTFIFSDWDGENVFFQEGNGDTIAEARANALDIIVSDHDLNPDDYRLIVAYEGIPKELVR